ncbi:TonB-dependent siderophore receptor [Apibacter sp. HY039]|uniref:TonB-dependent siderophore receptor n=1 Tax=Apibacter sp. HY039 TaxID=2501476 RepID=UPI000FEB9F0F|nr:TonB-dependent siderophore receptor [Apibacter sp. HY039]
MSNKLSILAIFGIAVLNAQHKDSIQDNYLKGIIIEGKYYKKYVEKKSSSSLRLDEELLKIPQNISVITNSVLQDQQITTLSDGVIRSIAGAQRLEHWGELYTRINMRGSRAAAFLNGVNITSTWGPLSEDMSYVDHIEIIKGPAGFLMSNGEPSGIYNIVTKQPTGKSFNGNARITLGSFDLYRGEVDLDSKISDKVAVRLNLMAQNKNSFRNYEFNDRYIINPSIKVNLTEKTTLIAEYIYQKAKMSDVGSAYVFSYAGYATKPVKYTLSDPGIAPTNIDSHTFNVNLQHQIDANWKLTTQLTYLNEYTLGSSLWPSVFNNDGTMIRRVGYWESSNIMKFGQAFLNGNVQTGVISHKILAGLDVGSKKYLADWSQGYNLDTAEKPFDTNSSVYQAPSNGSIAFNKTKSLEERAGAGSTISQTYSGIYLQDELGFFKDALRLTLAGRYTKVNQNDYGTTKKAEKVTPRIGLSYSIDENTSIYTLYDQAFTPQTGFLRSGKSVKPITGNSMEVGAKRDWFNGKLNTTISIYQIMKNNELTADPENTGSEKYSIVLGKTRTRGIEFDLKGEIVKGFNVIVNYALTSNKIIDSNTPEFPDGTKVAGYAKHTANAWLDYIFSEGLLKGFGLTFGGTYLGDRSTWNWGGNGKLSLDDYVKFDAGISWEKSNLKLTLNVYNLFDRYLYSGSTYGDYYYYQAEAPRNWRLSVGYKF